MSISKISIIRLAILFFLFASSAPDVITGSSIITLPVLASIPIIFLLFFNRIKIIFPRGEIFLILGFGFSVIMTLFHLNYAAPISLRHIGAFIFCYFAFYLIPYSLILKASRNDKNLFLSIFRTLEIVSIAVCLVIVLEYFGRNYFGFNLDDYIKHTGTEYEATFGLGQFRARGFFVESGHAAMYLESIGLISIIFSFLSRSNFRFGLSFLWIIAQYCLFSVASIGFTLFAVFLYVLFSKETKSNIRIYYLIFLMLGAFGIFIGLVFNQTLLAGFISKASIVTISNVQEGSASDRLSIYSSAFNCFFSQPFGIGWGIAPALNQSSRVDLCSVYAGQVSLPLEFLVAGGFLAVSFFLIWFTKNSFKLLGEVYPINLFSIPLIALYLHFFIVSDYWTPTLWLTIILARIIPIWVNQGNLSKSR